MSFKVWCADENEAAAKLYPRDPPALGTMIWDRWARDADDAAETYAEYFHNNRDGHECSWPVEFLVRDMETNVVQSFSVDREYDPTFSAGGGDVVAPGPHDDVVSEDMMCCPLSECGDGDGPDFSETTTPSARKPYGCTECGETITIAEIDRRIPIETYVRDPTPTEVGELMRLGAESIKPNVRRDVRNVRAKRRR